MLDKSKLGTRHICFGCGTKFYDLKRAVPECPECGTDQRKAPARTMRELLKGGKNRAPIPDDEPPVPKVGDDDDAAPKDDTLGLLDDADAGDSDDDE